MNHHHSSPNLLSFDSFEFDASTSTGPSLIASSLSGEDSLYSSFSNSTNTKPETKTINIKNTVRVNVSGTIYTLEKHVFDKLHSLPWSPLTPPPKTTTTASKTSSANAAAATANYVLRTAPEFFEILLNHVVYGTLPDLRNLRTADVEELEPLVLLLELPVLAQHLGLAASLLLHHKKKPRRVPSFRRRRQKKNKNDDNNMQQQQQQEPQQQQEQERSGLLLGGGHATMQQLSSLSSSSSLLSSSSNVTAADSRRRGRASSLVSSWKGRLGSNSNKNNHSERRLSHAELVVASDWIN